MSDVALKLAGVSKTYPGVHALDGMDLECLAGEIHAILGENGSGKSTLLGIASGTVTADAGSVEIAGHTLSAADPLLARSLGLATVYQDDSLVRELSVAQNLYLASATGEVSFRRMNEWARAQLGAYDLSIAPDTLVGDLTPAHRQFLEIVKALIAEPKVLLLDEPTSTLDIEGVEKLSGIVRELAARGTAIVYVSHRLPEILDLADRVTILRDGVGRGTFDVTDALSEHDLIALMVGRSIEAEYPPKGEGLVDRPVLSVEGLTGAGFHDVSFVAREGEIVGLAGAEGNGQREVLRALAGLVEATGKVSCGARAMGLAAPADALRAGVLFLSADRGQESTFPELGVRENMTLQKLGDYATGGLVSRQREHHDARGLIADYGIVTATLDQAINGLSGGNQQKSVLARSFHFGANAVLIDEPTQGVDAGARFDIYRAIRAKVRDGATCVVNSSDALELAGVCDRVLVFSRGRIVRELTGDEVTESKIVSSFLTARQGRTTAATEEKPRPGISRAMAMLAAGSVTWWVPLIFLFVLTLAVGGYAMAESDVFLRQVNIRHILLATAPLAMVAMAQFNVLLVRGFDVSVGSMMSLTVVTASFLVGFETGPAMLVVGILACLALGVMVGAINGSMVRFARVNPVIATIAMLSVLQGIALMIRPTPDGLIHQAVTGALRHRVGFIPTSALFLIAVAVMFDFWLHRTRSGLKLKAVGFREQAAKRNGVAVNFVHMRAYILSSLLATLAGFFLASEVGVGHPTAGGSYALSSITAAVLGGAALSGGRGSFSGALFGAFFFALTVNVISLLGFNTAVGIIASGVLTLLAVFLYSGLKPAEQLAKRVVRRLRGPGVRRARATA